MCFSSVVRWVLSLRPIGWLLRLSVVLVLTPVGLAAAATAAQSGSGPAAAAEQLEQAAEQEAQDQEQAQSEAVGDPFEDAEQSDRQALDTATGEFPELFAPISDSPLGTEAGDEVKRWLGSYAALVDIKEGGTAIVDSTSPAAVKVDGELEPVDLNVIPSGDDFRPERPVNPTRLPGELQDGVTFDAHSAIRLIGAQADGRQTGEQVSYVNALKDTDVFATAVPTGVQLSFQLRSPDSPKRLKLRFDVPEGTRLVVEKAADGEALGRVQLVDDADRTVSLISPPAAWDANGASVDVTYHVEGGDLVVDVPRDERVAYPVLVDPIIDNQFQSQFGYGANARMSDYRGWYREGNTTLFGFTPNNDDGNGTNNAPATGACYRGAGYEQLPQSLCVAAFYGQNFGSGSTGAWLFQGPSGQRSRAAGSDAYIYRFDVRAAYHKWAGSSYAYGSLRNIASGRWQGVFNDANSPASKSNAPMTEGLSPSTNNHSYYRTFCNTANCQESDAIARNVGGTATESTAPNTAVFGLAAFGSATQAVATMQGAALYQSDQSSPTIEVNNVGFSPTSWFRSGQTLRTDVTVRDRGMGVLNWAAYDSIKGNPTNGVGFSSGCTGSRFAPCGPQSAHSFNYSTSDLPDGQQAVIVNAYDALGILRQFFGSSDSGWLLKVDNGLPTVGAISGQAATIDNRWISGTRAYSYSVSAQDPEPPSQDIHVNYRTGQQSSGVKRLRTTLDGNENAAVGCGSSINCGQSATLTPSGGVDTAPLVSRNGAYKLSSYASDLAGNPEQGGGEVSFKKDGDAPTLSAPTHSRAAD